MVDDYPSNLRVLMTMLKNNNYQVRKALNGESAIKAIKLEPPDRILLDIKMFDIIGAFQITEVAQNP
nr:response regulator [Okeania sp. SIO2F4]